jgi:4,5-DOPA dioxygenase extradiol
MDNSRPRPLPPVFVSHGSPMTALEPGSTGPFWQRLGPAVNALAGGRPRAILAVSAHTLAREPVLLAAARHDTVHDFSGFPDALYRLRYDTAGAPALAGRVAALLRAAGLPVQVSDSGGLDHGIWTPLRFSHPDADVPVLPLAFPPDWTPAQLFALGEALRPLADEGVWVLATGSMTHNLRLVFGGRRPSLDAPEMPASAAFRRWFDERSADRDWDALLDYRHEAPHAQDMHPTDEHLLPWYVAAGAGGRLARPERLHDALTYGCLGMDAYAFGPGAADLARATA